MVALSIGGQCYPLLFLGDVYGFTCVMPAGQDLTLNLLHAWHFADSLMQHEF